MEPDRVTTSYTTTAIERLTRFINYERFIK